MPPTVTARRTMPLLCRVGRGPHVGEERHLAGTRGAYPGAPSQVRWLRGPWARDGHRARATRQDSAAAVPHPNPVGTPAAQTARVQPGRDPGPCARGNVARAGASCCTLPPARNRTANRTRCRCQGGQRRWGVLGTRWSSNRTVADGPRRDAGSVGYIGRRRAHHWSHVIGCGPRLVGGRVVRYWRGNVRARAPLRREDGGGVSHHSEGASNASAAAHQ